MQIKQDFSRGQVKNNAQNTWDPLLSPSFIIMKEKEKVLFVSNLDMYRVFQLDLTYFEVRNGQLKLTSKFKKR